MWKKLSAEYEKRVNLTTLFCDKHKKPLLVHSLNRVTNTEQTRFRSRKEPSSRSVGHVIKTVVM